MQNSFLHSYNILIIGPNRVFQATMKSLAENVLFLLKFIFSLKSIFTATCRLVSSTLSSTSWLYSSCFKTECVRDRKRIIEIHKTPHFHKMRNQLLEKGRGEQKGLANSRIKAILNFFMKLCSLFISSKSLKASF